MVKKRHLRVSLNKDEDQTNDDIPLWDSAQIVEETVNNVLKQALTGVLVYVAADTVRKVIIERAKK